MFEKFLDLYSTAYRRETAIKVKEDSTIILKALIKDSNYNGEDVIDGFDLRPKVWPNNIQIYVRASGGYYKVTVDFPSPLNSMLKSLSFLMVLFMCIVFSNGLWLLGICTPFLILLVTRLISWSRKKHVEDFLSSYILMKEQVLSHPKSPNPY